MADNRIIVDMNNKTDQLECFCTSYTIDTKSKVSVITKGLKYYIKSSSFKNVPLFIFFKALGIVNEIEAVQLIGNEMLEDLSMSFEDVEKEGIQT